MNANGLVLYSGPSRIDGAPIKAIVTGLSRPSTNKKTGPMRQLWILPKGDPFTALFNGADRAVCGDCPLRWAPDRKRVCYVNVAKAPRNIASAEYPVGDLPDHSVPIRLGAYGDPCALPLSVLRRAVGNGSYTGYTHQWREKKNQGYRALLMASVESVDDALAAQAIGWRTFRIGEERLPDEVWCPAAERPSRVTCSSCRLCCGMAKPKAPNVVIRQHA